jgi:hypothetical protein
MTFNFKKNLLIIVLMIIVILSTIVYINIQNIKETFISNRIDSINIIPETNDTSYNYYKLNTTAFNYVIKNIDMNSTNVNNYLNLVKTVSGDNFRDQTNRTIKDFFKSNKALVGHFKDNNTVALYNIILPNITLDITSVIKSTTDTNSVYILLLENSGNLYDLSNNKLSTTIKINNVEIIKSGVFQETKTPEAKEANSIASIGDINFSGLFGNTNGLKGMNNELFLYLLNQGSFGSSYVPPIYNNFETAMNLASNPIVNPVNSMNPLEYSQTLFGPQVTPMMSKNAYMNSDINIASANNKNNNSIKDNNDPISKSNTNTSVKDIFKFDTDGNLLSQNIDNKKSDNNSNCTNVNVDNNLLKEKCAPCPAPQRCPESNFECKKVPNYEQGIDNAFLPRPVLADFSTFGM